MARRRKRRKFLSVTLIVIAIGLIVGVVSYGIYTIIGTNEESDSNSQEKYETVTVSAEAEKESSEDESSTDDNQDDSDSMDFKFLSGYSYTFSSGAGGWSDNFKIEKDGYFHGSFRDSDMGDVNDDYPNGICYFCDYEGHFADIKKIDEYTYTMKMTDLTVTSQADGYIEDGVKYLLVSPYALSEADEVQIYLPGKPVADFSDNLKMWLEISYQDQQDTLENLALVNVNEDQGICSYKRESAKEEAKSLYDSALASYDYYSEDIANASTTAELTELTAAQALAADDVLNSLWILVKYNTDEATYEKVLAEQRKWIADKDAALSVYNSDDYGTMWSVDYNEELCHLTLDRCKELLEYIQ